MLSIRRGCRREELGTLCPECPVPTTPSLAWAALYTQAAILGTTSPGILASPDWNVSSAVLCGLPKLGPCQSCSQPGLCSEMITWSQHGFFLFASVSARHPKEPAQKDRAKSKTHTEDWGWGWELGWGGGRFRAVAEMMSWRGWEQEDQRSEAGAAEVQMGVLRRPPRRSAGRSEGCSLPGGGKDLHMRGALECSLLCETRNSCGKSGKGQVMVVLAVTELVRFGRSKDTNLNCQGFDRWGVEKSSV